MKRCGLAPNHSAPGAGPEAAAGQKAFGVGRAGFKTFAGLENPA
jgi:hypothetical protein